MADLAEFKLTKPFKYDIFLSEISTEISNQCVRLKLKK